MKRWPGLVAWLWPALAGAACGPPPLDGRDLYLRGSFNTWAAVEAQRFVWACDRFELVVRIDGEHRFKVADEGWSLDADFGGEAGALRSKGPELRRRFSGVFRFTLGRDMKTLKIEDCPRAAPFGDTVLFLRGSMNHWAARDDQAFLYHCDAYYLNVDLRGRHEFKVADAAWSAATSFGDGGAPFKRDFDGAHTLRLAFDGAGQPQLTLGAKTFADPRTQPVSDPIALSLRFDSRDAAHKTPFGAVVPGTELAWTVHAAPGVTQLTMLVESRRLEGNQERLEYSELKRLPMTRSAVDGADRWTARHRFDAIGVYGYWFEARIGGRAYALQNNHDAVFWTRETGSGGVASIGEMPPHPRAIRRFRQTVYAADFQVPDWAADAVYYYIFPERFRNGDPANDPKPGRDRYHDHTVERHADWNERPFRPGSGDGSDAHYNNDFFGGDLAGIVDKLDHIRDLGANAIYMTPVFRAASNHKYDTADYRVIDPAFGTNDDFQRLTGEAARRGMRIVPDTSLNHTGSDSIYFDRFGNFAGSGSCGAFEGGRIRPDSPYAGWYRFDPGQADPDRQYTGWVGVADLPELDKGSASFRAFAYGDAEAVMKQWLDLGAAGWRMDVAPWVPDHFWRPWRQAIKAHRPDAITIAETWFDAAKHLLGDMFDSTMNYIFRDVVLAYAAGGDAVPLVRQLEMLREHYPPQALHALMNLVSSHDKPRALHVLGGRDGVDAATLALAKRRLRLAMFVLFSYPGAPAIYYGDEVGLSGGDDPDNRRTYPWADLGGAPDEALRADVKALAGLRAEHPVLRRGSLGAPLLVDANVIVLPRRLGALMALTASNNAETARTVSVALPADAGSRFVDAQSGELLQADRGQLSLSLPALGGRVLLAQP